MVNLRQIDANTTVDEVKEAQREVSRAWDDLVNSVGDLNDVQYQETEQAFRELDRTINNIPDDATLAEAQATIRLAALATVAEYSDIASTTCAYGQR